MFHLSITAFELTWACLWLAVYLTYHQPKTAYRGYIWKLLRKIPPFKIVKGDGPHERLTLFFMQIGCLAAITWTMGYMLKETVYWGVQIVLILDDHFNGDDDERKKRWQTVKNKIRWRTFQPTLRPAPAPNRPS